MTDIMFRVDKEGILFALFPGLAGTNEPHTCLCYEVVGQHSSADLKGCINASRPATSDEYATLQRELVHRGYNDLRIVKRSNRYHQNARELQLEQK